MIDSALSKAIFAVKLPRTGEPRFSRRVCYVMKRKILLVANGDVESDRTIADAANQAGRSLRRVSSSRQALEILAMGLEDVDVVIIDIDPGVHSLALLEALDYSQVAPPVIAVTSLGESEAAPVARRHGAVACLGKPFSAAQMVALVEDVLASFRARRPSCDRWGHPRSANRRIHHAHAA